MARVLVALRSRRVAFLSRALHLLVQSLGVKSAVRALRCVRRDSRSRSRSRSRDSRSRWSLANRDASVLPPPVNFFADV